MNKTLSKKTILFTRILPTLKEQSAYFSLAAVKRALIAAEIELADDTLRFGNKKPLAPGLISSFLLNWKTETMYNLSISMNIFA